MPPRPSRPDIPQPSGASSRPSGSLPNVPASPRPPVPSPPSSSPTPEPDPVPASAFGPEDEHELPLCDEPVRTRPAPKVTSEEPRERGGKSKKPLLLAGGVGAGVLLLAGGAFAYSALAPAPGGPEEAVPSSALIFAKVDLDPSADQKVAFLRLKEKFPDLDTEEGKEVSLQETVADAFFDELDYATEVEPWIGDRFAVSALPNPNAEEYESTVHMVAVYSVKDAGAAEKAAAKISEPSAVYDGKYLVVSDTEESLAAWKKDIEQGSLADSKEYRDDMSHLDGNLIASVWVDVERSNALAEEVNSATGLVQGGLLQEATKGSLVGGIHLEKNAVQAQFVALEAGIKDEIDLSNGNVSDVANLPGDAIVAVAVANLDKTLASLWTEYRDEIDEYTLQELNSLGLSLPEDFKRIVGTQTAVGVSGLDMTTGEPRIMARLKGADETLWNTLRQDMVTDPDTMLINKDGDTVLLTTPETGSGKLGDNPNFKNAVPNYDKALFVAFADIDGIMEQMGDVDEESYGYVGAAASYNEKKDTADVTIRWVFDK